MDRIGQGWRFCWATAEDEQGSKDVESASKKVSRVVHPGSSQNRENCKVMRV